MVARVEPPIESARLSAIAALVPRGARVADVGSGHGILARRLVASGKAEHCVATERTPLLARRIRTLPPHHPRSARLEIRAGDGLAPLRAEDRIDLVVLAGLGGRVIRSVLDSPAAAMLARERFVLQPQTEIGPLRRWLVERGYALTGETAVSQRGRLYFVLSAERGPAAEPEPHPWLSRDDLLEAGPWLVRAGRPEVIAWWRREHARNRRWALVASPGHPGVERARARIAQAERILAAMEAAHAPME